MANANTKYSEPTEELSSLGTESPMLRAGAFDGSLDRLIVCKTGLDALRPGYW